MGKATVVVLALALAAASAKSARPPGSRPRMERTPAYVLAYCEQSRRLPLACPHLLPRMSRPSPHWEASLCLAGRPGYIGTFTWGGRRGTVVLAPDFPAGGEQGGHLIFRWREGRTDFALGLHGWTPLAQALATLRRMVISIQREPTKDKGATG